MAERDYKVFDADGIELEIGDRVRAGKPGAVVGFTDYDVDYSDELERAHMFETVGVEVAFDDGERETFETTLAPPRWMYDDEYRFTAEELDKQSPTGGNA